MADCLTDACAKPIPLQEDWQCPGIPTADPDKPYLVHEGMMKSALWLHDEVPRHPGPCPHVHVLCLCPPALHWSLAPKAWRSTEYVDQLQAPLPETAGLAVVYAHR